MNDTLQQIIEAHVASTQLEWQIEDAAERPWTAGEWIFLFIVVLFVFLCICAAIQKRKNKTK